MSADGGVESGCGVLASRLSGVQGGRLGIGEPPGTDDREGESGGRAAEGGVLHDTGLPGAATPSSSFRPGAVAPPASAQFAAAGGFVPKRLREHDPGEDSIAESVSSAGLGVLPPADGSLGHGRC